MTRVNSKYDNLRSGTSSPIEPFPYIGLVKRNDDPQHMGRLSVWIPEICGDPSDSGSWIICSYMSPFAGATDITKIKNYSGDPNVGQQSYGFVGVPPDLNAEVMVVFVAGQLNRAYWIGCTIQQNMNHMIPGIAVDVTTQGGPAVPVTEYNKANVQGDPNNPRRPIFQPLADGLRIEGLTSDDERGSSSSSMRRESPPLVYGLLSPRGNTVHIDDNKDNEFIRLRTKSGAQVLIHETTGYVYIVSKDGNAWFEISDTGIDGYSANSISFRAEKDINFRADGNIFLDAGSNISLRAGQQITLDAGKHIQAGAGRNIIMSCGASINLKATGGDLQAYAGQNLRLQSGADTSSFAAGAWLRKGSPIQDNPPTTVPAATVLDALVPVGKDTLDSRPSLQGSNTVWKFGRGKVNTIVDRMPTHEPWEGHPNSKVPPPPLTKIEVNYGATNGVGGHSNVYPDGTLNDAGCSFGVGNTKPISTDVHNAITAAAAKTGVNTATLLAFADMETGFQPGISSNSSSATGLFQFTSDTWQGMMSKYGNKFNIPNTPDSIYNPNYNAMMGAQFISDNSVILNKQGISDPTPGQLYVMHFLGSSGGPKMIQAVQNDPTASAASLFPTAAEKNRNLFYNTDGSSKTVSDVYNNMTSQADAKSTAYASQYGLPAPCERGNGVSGNSPSTAAPSKNTNAAAYNQYTGKVYGDGECPKLVQQIAGLPNTSSWQAGKSILIDGQLDPSIPVGTPIATFGPNGTYTNSKNETSHAALLLGPAPSGNGIQVLDQYVGQPSQIRNIYFDNSKSIVGNAANYKIINLPSS